MRDCAQFDNPISKPLAIPGGASTDNIEYQGTRFC